MLKYKLKDWRNTVRRIKIINVLILSSLLGLFLIGCGKHEETSRVMDEAKIAFASKEYEKAEGILKLAMDEKKGKEADRLYEQVKAFREIMDRVCSMNSADSIGNLSQDTGIDGLFHILKNLKIIEENKTESNLVTSELTKYVEEVRDAIGELTDLYKSYIYKGDIKNAEEYFTYMSRIDSYKLECLKEYGLNVDEYEKLLKEAKEVKASDSKESGYVREEAYKIAKEKMKLIGIQNTIDGDLEQDKTIEGENCYFANIEFIVNNMPRTDQIYIGSKTLNVYSFDGVLRTNLKYDN